MYKVSYELCTAYRKSSKETPKNIKSNTKNAKLEATIICNLATFIFRQRNNFHKAKEMFLEGIRMFPSHKGLQKNFSCFLNLNLDKIKNEDSNLLDEYNYLVKVDS